MVKANTTVLTIYDTQYWYKIQVNTILKRVGVQGHVDINNATVTTIKM